MIAPPKLRDYQEDAIEGCRASYRSGKRAPVLVLPTGAGKTVVFVEMARAHAKMGGRPLVLVHRTELLNQTSAKLAAVGAAHGCIAPGHLWQPDRPTQVASVQTLVSRFPLLRAAKWEPTLIIIDEGHHATAGSWRKIVDEYPKARILGCTATPCRADGAPLCDIYDDIVIGPQTRELIDRGHLCEPLVYRPPAKFDLSGVRTSGADWKRDELAERVDKPVVTGDAVEHYARHAFGVPAVAFCVSIAHAQHVSQQFRDLGWRSAVLDGTQDPRTRADLIAGLGDGRIQVLCTVDVVSEGTDIPTIGCAILLRPTQSLSLYLQQVGRALRPSPGKEYAIILDHAGNSLTHGLPDDLRVWSLERKVKRGRGMRENDGPPPPYTCLGCYAQLRHPVPNACPGCGRVVPGRDRMASIELADGELQLAKRSEEAARKLAAQQAEQAKAKERRARAYEEVQAKTLDALVALGRRRGYADPVGWASRRFFARAQKGEAHSAAPITIVDQNFREVRTEHPEPVELSDATLEEIEAIFEASQSS